MPVDVRRRNGSDLRRSMAAVRSGDTARNATAASTDNSILEVRA